MTKGKSDDVVTAAEEQKEPHRISPPPPPRGGGWNVLADGIGALERLRWEPTPWQSGASSVGTWEEARWGHENWTGILVYLLLKFSTLATLRKYFHLKMEKLLCASGPSFLATFGILQLSGTPSYPNVVTHQANPPLWTRLLFPISDNLAVPLNSAKGWGGTQSGSVQRLWRCLSSLLAYDSSLWCTVKPILATWVFLHFPTAASIFLHTMLRGK